MTMTPRLSRLFAILVLIVVLAIPYHLVIQPIVQQHLDLSAQIEDQRELLSEFRRSGANLDLLRAYLDEADGQPFLNAAYLSGETEALAAAQLQNFVKQAVEQAGGILNSTQILPAESNGRLRKVTARINMTGTMDAVFQTLYRLEAAKPMLFLDNVDMGSRSNRRRARQRRRTDAKVMESDLNVAFDISGYMRGS